MPKKKPGNQHNNRHENGIVAPGKRVTKQKSNGQLNGSAEGNPSANGLTTPSSSAARATPQEVDNLRNGEATATGTSHSRPRLQDGTVQEENAEERGVSGQLQHPNGSAHSSLNKVDTNTLQGPSVRKDNVFSLAYTIIRSCPLGDTLTILIILLSVPSTVLTLINFLFAVLTFMTPATSFFSFPNTLTDIFQSSGGTPSLATILITDFLGLVIWLAAWTPVQGLAIEFSQAVVAATLGGGNTARKSGYSNTIFCVAIVGLRHIPNCGWIPSRIFGFDWRDILSRIPFISERPSSFYLFSVDDYLTTDAKGGWGWGWIRIGVALHILIQGLVHGARRWVQKREDFQSASLTKKMDSDTSSGTPPRRTSHNIGETVQQNSNSLAPHPANKGSLPIAKEMRDKTSSGKKKRKQAQFIRSQQPLWAAFAATKVTIMREYEQNHAMADITVPDAKDATNLGNAAFGETDDQVWISDVLDNSFIFHTTYGIGSKSSDEHVKMENGLGIDRSKPIYVRINDTNWTSTRISRNEEVESPAGAWLVVVFGLAPSSSYRCSLVQTEGDVVLCSIVVTTSPSPSEENESSTTPNDLSQRSQRPFSPTTPTTTLKKSIAAYEASVNESLAHQKKNKKDNKATSTAIKKEIDVLNAKITKLAGEDRSHTNRHMQWNQLMKQADEAGIALTEEIEALDNTPDDETETFKKKRAHRETIKDQRDATRIALIRAKDTAQRDKTALQAEANSAHQKKERLLARRSKLNDQCERLESTMHEGLHDQRRKTSEQEAKDLQRVQLDREIQERMATLNHAWHESRYAISQYTSQAHLLQSAFQEQQIIINSPPDPPQRPLTPEGDLPGENPHNAVTAASHLPAFGTPESAGGLRSHSNSLRKADKRQRSSSLLSNNSNYVDLEDLDPVPPMPARAVEAIRGARKQSGGSAGGSSGSNSQRDPASPVGNRNQDSPVGKSPVWNQ